MEKYKELYSYDLETKTFEVETEFPGNYDHGFKLCLQ